MADTTRIPIDISVPGFTGNPGNAFWNPTAMTAATPDFDLGLWEYVLDVDGDLFGQVTIPNVIGATPAAKVILTILANATTGVSTMQIDARSMANDGQTLNVAMVAETEQDITMPGTAYMNKEISFTLPTSSNDYPVAAKDLLMVRMFHKGSAINDTLAANTLLVRAALEIDLS